MLILTENNTQVIPASNVCGVPDWTGPELVVMCFTTLSTSSSLAVAFTQPLSAIANKLKISALVEVVRNHFDHSWIRATGGNAWRTCGGNLEKGAFLSALGQSTSTSKSANTCHEQTNGGAFLHVEKEAPIVALFVASVTR